ncbi:hypothetical protein V6N13_120335 [Hibiscus sabdariffa]
MFISSNTIMRTAPVPDLSLQISLPSVSDCKAKEMAYDVLSGKSIYSDRSSTTDSGSSGSDLSRENGYGNPGLGEPTLSLGFEMADLGSRHLQQPRNPHQQQHHQQQQQQHYQPQIYGRDFKRNARMINGAVKRSVRAPRMRWTTTLHAHFVHAVQLLGGHESNIFTLFPVSAKYRKYKSLHICIGNCHRSNTKISLRVDECQGSNPSSCEESFAGGVTVGNLHFFERIYGSGLGKQRVRTKGHLGSRMYRTVKITGKGPGQGQTDISLNQRMEIVDLDGTLFSAKADPNASYSSKLSTTPPQRTQSGSWLSSKETNNLSISNPGNDLTFEPNNAKVDGDKASLHVSDGMKERLDSGSLSPSDMFLNLEFTLGRPSWKMDYAESSNELALLRELTVTDLRSLNVRRDKIWVQSTSTGNQ